MQILSPISLISPVPFPCYRVSLSEASGEGAQMIRVPGGAASRLRGGGDSEKPPANPSAGT